MSLANFFAKNRQKRELFRKVTELQLCSYPMIGRQQKGLILEKRLFFFADERYRIIEYQHERSSSIRSFNEKPTRQITMPTGWYDFVIKKELPSVIFLTEQTQSGTIGHSTVAKFKSVHFAGELFFAPEAGYRDDEDKYFRYGDLVLWTNKSGHYQVGAKFGHSSRAKDKIFELVEKQTALAMLGGIRLLPMDSFFQWDGDI